MNTKEALIWANVALRAKEVREPESSALVLLGDVLGMSRTELLGYPDKEITSFQILKFKKYIAKRKKNESVWHIIGKVQFCGLDFTVNKDVLVPRPETELLVEQVTRHIAKQTTNDQRPMTILDLGTGSGAIAIALASKLKTDNTKHQIVATDISAKALRVAKINTKKLKVEKYIQFVKCDLFPPTTSDQRPVTKFDIITANLPYIPSEDMEALAFDVYHYEPKLALDGGCGGLEVYERMLSNASKYLKRGGRVFCEIGINQGDEFKILVGKYLPKSTVQILGDLAGIDRIAIIEVTKK